MSKDHYANNYDETVLISHAHWLHSNALSLSSSIEYVMITHHAVCMLHNYDIPYDKPFTTECITTIFSYLQNTSVLMGFLSHSIKKCIKCSVL